MKKYIINILIVSIILHMAGCRDSSLQSADNASKLGDVLSSSILKYFNEKKVYPSSLLDLKSLPFKIKCSRGHEGKHNCGRQYLLFHEKGNIHIGAGSTTSMKDRNQHLMYGFTFSFDKISCSYYFTVSGSVEKNCHSRTPGGFRQ